MCLEGTKKRTKPQVPYMVPRFDNPPWPRVHDRSLKFFDSKFVTRGEGREVTRVKRSGVVKLSVDVMTRGMGTIAEHGMWNAIFTVEMFVPFSRIGSKGISC